MKTIFLLLFILLYTCQTQAQNIHGQVTDSLTHEPLVGATVTLHRENTGTFIDYAVTDAKGHFFGGRGAES